MCNFCDSRWLLLDVCNISAPSKLQRSVQQRLGRGGQENRLIYLKTYLLNTYQMLMYRDVYTSYYQWVTFVLLIQAGFFIFPYKLWKILEGGLMESFGTDGKSAILLSEEAKYEDDE